jgi:ribose transport system substrate-binding protein
MHQKVKRFRLGLAVAAAGLMLVAACGSSTDSNSKSSGTSGSSSEKGLRETRGPAGETATAVADLQVTDDVIKKATGKAKTAAIMWPDSTPFFSAAAKGIEDTFKKLDIEVVSVTDSGFDSAKERDNFETVFALKPDIIVALIVDPVASAETFRPAVEAGTKLALLSNVPKGYKQGQDYVSLVTDDLFAMGSQAAKALAGAMDEKGKVGYIYHDADFYVTNQRDRAFKTIISEDYPNMEIVAEAGMADPARVEEIASAMITQHPDMTGIYVPWTPPAEDVLAAIRAAGRDDIKLTTLDLSVPSALDMLQGGPTVAMVADASYEIGRGLASAVALDLAGEKVPPFIVAPAVTVTKDNLVEAWKDSLGVEPPAQLLEAVNKN